jgi:hypothetical protein
MTLFPVQMHINRPVISQYFPHQNQALAQELNELRPDNLIPVRLFPVFHKILFCGKRGVNIDELYAVFCLIFVFVPLIIIEGFEGKKIVAENEHIPPLVIEWIVTVE